MRYQERGGRQKGSLSPKREGFHAGGFPSTSLSHRGGRCSNVNFSSFHSPGLHPHCSNSSALCGTVCPEPSRSHGCCSLWPELPDNSPNPQESFDPILCPGSFPHPPVSNVASEEFFYQFPGKKKGKKVADAQGGVAPLALWGQMNKWKSFCAPFLTPLQTHSSWGMHQGGTGNACGWDSNCPAWELASTALRIFLTPSQSPGNEEGMVMFHGHVGGEAQFLTSSPSPWITARPPLTHRGILRTSFLNFGRSFNQ